MHITLKLFAAYRETLGTDQLVMPIQPGMTVGQFFNQFLDQYPLCEPWRGVTRFAVNQDFIDPEYPLQSGDELVLIPPVSGG